MSDILDKMNPLPCAECGEPNTRHHVCAPGSNERLVMCELSGSAPCGKYGYCEICENVPKGLTDEK